MIFNVWYALCKGPILTYAIFIYVKFTYLNIIVYKFNQSDIIQTAWKAKSQKTVKRQ